MKERSKDWALKHSNVKKLGRGKQAEETEKPGREKN